MSDRKNSHVTDMKWNSKKRLRSMRSKAEELSYQWGDIDFLVVGLVDEVIAKIDEIEQEITSISPSKF